MARLWANWGGGLATWVSLAASLPTYAHGAAILLALVGLAAVYRLIRGSK